MGFWHCYRWKVLDNHIIPFLFTISLEYGYKINPWMEIRFREHTIGGTTTMSLKPFRLILQSITGKVSEFLVSKKISNCLKDTMNQVSSLLCSLSSSCVLLLILLV